MKTTRMKNSMSLELADLSERLGGVLTGQGGPVTSLCDPANPQRGGIAVIESVEQVVANGNLAALVVPEGLELDTPLPLIRVKHARLALAQLSELFDRREPLASGVHPSASVHPEASLELNVSIGAHAVIALGAVIGAGTVIGAGCVVGPRVQIGPDCLLHANVSLYEGVRLGARVILHSGVVLGADGFGYAPSDQGAQKIRHLGRLVVEDDVEIGANSCIDRATLGATRIGARTKIDNLCQLGHNVKIGQDCMIAGMVGIAGSTTLGDRVRVGGSAGLGDHLEIGDDVTIAARAGVTKNISAGETWAGFPAEPYKRYVRRLYLQNRLERIWQFVKGASK